MVDSPSTEPSTQENKWRAEQKKFWERQLSIAKWLNWITGFAALAGFAGIYVLYGTLDATRIAANATKVQADSARQELEVSHRPWVASVRPAEVTGPFTFTNGGATFEVTVPIKNTGTSTAINVFPQPSMIVQDRNKAHDYLMRAVQTANCDSPGMLEVLARVMGGTPIPPGTEINYRVPESSGTFPSLKPDTIVQIWLYLCLSYKDVLITPAKSHYYCVVEDFRNSAGQREFPAQGVVNGTFEISNGGCAN